MTTQTTTGSLAALAATERQAAAAIRETARQVRGMGGPLLAAVAELREAARDYQQTQAQCVSEVQTMLDLLCHGLALDTADLLADVAAAQEADPHPALSASNGHSDRLTALYPIPDDDVHPLVPRGEDPAVQVEQETDAKCPTCNSLGIHRGVFCPDCIDLSAPVPTREDAFDATRVEAFARPVAEALARAEEPEPVLVPYRCPRCGVKTPKTPPDDDGGLLCVHCFDGNSGPFLEPIDPNSYHPPGATAAGDDTTGGPVPLPPDAPYTDPATGETLLPGSRVAAHEKDSTLPKPKIGRPKGGKRKKTT